MFLCEFVYLSIIKSIPIGVVIGVVTVVVKFKGQTNGTKKKKW